MGMLNLTIHMIYMMNAKLSVFRTFVYCASVIVQRQRTQVNGKILEDGNTVHADGAMNGA